MEDTSWREVVVDGYDQYTFHKCMTFPRIKITTTNPLEAGCSGACLQF